MKKEHHQRALALKSSVSESTAIDVTCCEQNSNRQKLTVQKCVQSAAAGSGNRPQTAVIDISEEKQKQAVTSFDYKELQPVADSFRISTKIPKSNQADGEGFEPTVLFVRRFSRPVP